MVKPMRFQRTARGPIRHGLALPCPPRRSSRWPGRASFGLPMAVLLMAALLAVAPAAEAVTRHASTVAETAQSASDPRSAIPDVGQLGEGFTVVQEATGYRDVSPGVVMFEATFSRPETPENFARGPIEVRVSVAETQSESQASTLIETGLARLTSRTPPWRATNGPGLGDSSSWLVISGSSPQGPAIAYAVFARSGVSVVTVIVGGLQGATRSEHAEIVARDILRRIALQVVAPPIATDDCRFVSSFFLLREQIGAERVGRCLENQVTLETGDARQRTEMGEMVWRRYDGVTAFTDGYQTWIAGPNGIEVRLNSERLPWEGAPSANSSRSEINDRTPATPTAAPRTRPEPTPRPAVPPSVNAAPRCTEAVGRIVRQMLYGDAFSGLMGICLMAAETAGETGLRCFEAAARNYDGMNDPVAETFLCISVTSPASR